MYADEQPNFLHINQQVATPSFTFTTKSLGNSASKAPQHHHHQGQSRHDSADEVPTSLYRTSVSRAAAPSETRSGYGGEEPTWRAGSVMLGDEGSDTHHHRHASFSERFSSVLSAPLPASLQTSSRGGLPAHHQAAGRIAGSSSRAGSASTSRAMGGKPQTVHDSLYEQGRLYKAMREELQAKAAKEELKKVTGSPSVSRYANEKAMERRKRLGRPEDVVERMEAATNAARAKTDKKRQEVLERRRRQQEEEDFGITSAASEDESCFGDVTMPSHSDHHNSSTSRHQQPSASKGSRRPSSAAALRATSGGKSILRAGSSNRPATRTLSFSPGAKARTTSGVSGTSHRPAANVSPGHQRNGSSRRRTRTPFQPRLTEKGRNAEAKVTAPEYLAQHQHRAQQRADAHRTDRLLKDLQQCRDVPEITLRSKELTQRRAEREGTAGLSYIDAMLERDRISKEALAQKAEQRRIEENHFHPRITAYAATLGQGAGAEGAMGASSVMRASQQSHAERARMDVAERLYADSFAMEERRAERARKIDGQRSGTNRANSRTSSVNRDGAPHVPVGDRLLRQHEEAMRERQRRIAEEDELTRLTSRPAIDPVSAAITARLPETVQERLLGSRSGAGGANSRFQQQRREEDVLERRAIPPRRVLSPEEEERMLHKLHNYDERRREKLRQLQSEREEEELAECTFRPNTTNTYYTGETHFDPSSAPPSEETDRNHMHFTQFDTQALADQENRDPEPGKQSSWRDISIVERNAQWAAQRNARLEAQRTELKDREVEGCTFKPEVQARNPPPSSAVPPSRHADPLDPRSSVSTGRSASTPGTIYGGDGTPWGVHEYLARQQYARYLQLEKEYKLTGKRPPPPPQPFDPAAMYQSNDDDTEGSIVSSSTEGNRPSLSPQPRGGRGENYETDSTTTRSAPSQSRPPTQGGPIASLRPPSGPGDVRGLLDVSHDHGDEYGSLSHRRGGSLLVPPSMR